MATTPNDTKSKPLYIITGATDSIGSVVAKRLAAQGKALLLASFDTEKCQHFAKELTVSTLNSDISCLHLDLSTFAGVKTFVASVKALNRPIAALINNASYISRHSELSPDGYEKIIQVNFLSTVLLSELMIPLLGEGSKIIFSSSLSRRFVSLPYEFPAVSNFIPVTAFGQSKLALSLFSIYMSTVLRGKHISVNCADLGLFNRSILSLGHWLGNINSSIAQLLPNVNDGASALMRAIESTDTGFIFKGSERQIKISTILKNREVFIKLCNDTMRLIKKEIE